MPQVTQSASRLRRGRGGLPFRGIHEAQFRRVSGQAGEGQDLVQSRRCRVHQIENLA